MRKPEIIIRERPTRDEIQIKRVGFIKKFLSIRIYARESLRESRVHIIRSDEL